ncbi:HAMP domain-containing sensor histidine kinase [Bacillus sp. FJAT-51639]|uniref:histidine kinase n=1 Tax=Bacillus bruguierae TaxID=3127667 RepID=A0ABU8FNK6_9BACI
MNKLGKKLFISISIAIFLIFTISLLLTNYFLPKYNLYKTKEQINKVTAQIKQQSKEEFINDISRIEQQYNISIVYVPINSTADDINWSLRERLSKKQITLSKFWIVKEDLKHVKEGGKVNTLYDQEKLKASFFASFIAKDDMLVLVGVSIAHSNEIIQMINQFNLYIFGFSIVLVIVLVWVLSKNITRPLKELSDVAKDISNLNFKKANIKTNDEIEDLAVSINVMSNKLNKAHQDLTQKNENLKVFMANITHELKTPISLAKAYSLGIKDGLDDGTYVDTIIKQTDNISHLIEELLRFSKIERDAISKETFNVVSLFYSILQKYEIEMQSKNIKIDIEANQSEMFITADKNKMEMIFNNLITNAIKYTTNYKIIVEFKELEEQVLFNIRNGVDQLHIKDIEKIWEPFFVLESSRSKEISGTGLGLAIVKGILERHGFQYGVRTFEKEIQFYMYMEKSL